MPQDDTLAELFARNPFQYESGDVERIIAEMREKRKVFKLTGKPAKADAPIVDLKELGLL